MRKLEELIKQEQQLKYRIQLEKNKLNAVARKRRDGKLISEAMLNDPEESMTPEQWAAQCKYFLTDKRTLSRAFVDELGISSRKSLERKIETTNN